MLNYEPTVFPEGWSSRLMFFDQSHFKFTLNQTGDTSRVLDRVFLGANSSKVTPREFPHPVEITN